MTDQQIVDELDRIERELRATAEKSAMATQEAMRIIERLMNDLGIPVERNSGVV